MEQQNNYDEKGVKIFYVKNMLRNRYGFKPSLAEFLSKFTVDFFEHLYDGYDYEKVKHIRNAQSNLGLYQPTSLMENKITFYIGLMDKDDFSYKFSKHSAIKKVTDVLGDCTIQDAIGTFTRKDGQKVQTETLVVTKFLEKYDGNFIHYKAKELKEIFNQLSILTEETGRSLIEFNDESKEMEREIEELMQEYEWTWAVAKDAYESGLF